MMECLDVEEDLYLTLESALWTPEAQSVPYY